MPSPTHSGSRPRIGLTASLAWVTDRVIGAAGFPKGVSGRIQPRQGIILGKAAPANRGKRPRKSGFGHINARRLQQEGASGDPVAGSRPAPEVILRMKRLLSLAGLAAIAALQFPAIAHAQRAEYD